MVEEFVYEIKIKTIDTWRYGDCIAHHRTKKTPSDTCYFYYNPEDIHESFNDFDTTLFVETLFKYGFCVVNSIYVDS